MDNKIPCSEFHSDGGRLITLFCLLLNTVLLMPYFLVKCAAAAYQFWIFLKKEKKKRKRYRKQIKFLAWSSSHLHPSMDLINVKHAKYPALRYSWGTALSLQLFGIMPQQIKCVSRFLSSKICLVSETDVPYLCTNKETCSLSLKQS